MLMVNICSDLIEEILSPEEDEDGGVRFGGGSCCNSSHFSDNNKSEKNMSDFDGEGVLSDEEIVTLSRSMTGVHGHLCPTDGLPSSPRRIPGVATIYPKHHLHAPIDSAQGWPSFLSVFPLRNSASSDTGYTVNLPLAVKMHNTVMSIFVCCSVKTQIYVRSNCCSCLCLTNVIICFKFFFCTHTHRLTFTAHVPLLMPTSLFWSERRW